MMASFVPGSVVLYREPNTDLPPWPSVYCTDDVAPPWFLQTRPFGYVTLVLKLSRIVDAGQLRWVTTNNLSHFDPFAADAATRHSTPGLVDAYEVADIVLDIGLELSHWKAALASDQDDDATVINSEDDDEMSNDPQMRLAIEMSMRDIRSQEAQNFPTPLANRATPSTVSSAHPERLLPRVEGSMLPHFNNQRRLPIHRPLRRPSRLLTPTSSPPSKSGMFGSDSYSSKRPSPRSFGEPDDKLSSPQQRRKFSNVSESSKRAERFRSSSQSSQSTVSPIFVISDDDDLPLSPRRKKSWATSLGALSKREPHSSARGSKGTAAPGISAQQVLHRSGLNASAPAAPDDDVIAEEFDESNHFVQIFIGPETEPTGNNDIDPQRRRYKLQLPKQHVWDRPYFRDTLSARNYIEPIGHNTWELVHPRLVDILPEDFRWAAEYLSDGDFGHREPDTEEEVADTFAQCMSAWRTAELLNMDDLLEHVVDKIRAAQPWWDLWNVMAFAVSIYQSETSLQAHDELKALFSEYIANLFHIYLGDDHLSGTFIDRLKQLPQLERDVLMKRVAQLERRVQPQEEEAVVQEEGQEEYMDLYN